MEKEKDEKLDELIEEFSDKKDDSSDIVLESETKNIEKVLNQDQEEVKKTNIKEGKKKKKRKGLIVFIILVILTALGLCGYYFYNKLNSNVEIETESNEYKSEFRMSGNDIQDFDLYFLQLENAKNNAIYSPLSIKYALAMLADGSKGDSKEQITSVIGDYSSKKYVNSANLSLANVMFIRNGYKDSLVDTYTNNLKEKYNADVIFDDFQSATPINNWVSDHTFKLIQNTFDDATVKSLEFALVNALAIDMEWNYQIQAQSSESKVQRKFYHVNFKHEKYQDAVRDLEGNDVFDMIDFDNGSMKVSAPEFGATLSNYDIIKELGENNIRNEVEKEYREYLKNPNCGEETDEASIKEYLDNYMKEIGSNYKFVDYSTDFMFHKDSDVTVFAKDLKTYDNTTLQYVAVMPNNEELSSFIENLNAKKVKSILNNLKELKYDSLEYGKVYKLRGHVPVFKAEYELKLKDDLKKLGIKDVFSSAKADLSPMISDSKGMFIDAAVHKANIEFSNDGIKAGAVTAMGGKGAMSCPGFDKIYDVPVEEIDLTFNKPFIYLIRDKDTGEVWFTGRIYEPKFN